MMDPYVRGGGGTGPEIPAVFDIACGEIAEYLADATTYDAFKAALDLFYRDVAQDPILGPVFEGIREDKWARMSDMTLAVIMTANQKGSLSYMRHAHNDLGMRGNLAACRPRFLVLFERALQQSGIDPALRQRALEIVRALIGVTFR